MKEKMPNQKPASGGSVEPGAPCGHFEKFNYTAYFEKTMDEHEARHFDQHCETCPACRDALFFFHERFIADANARHAAQCLARAQRKVAEKFSDTATENFEIIVRCRDGKLHSAETSFSIAVAESDHYTSGQSPPELKLKFVQLLAQPPLIIEILFAQKENCHEILLRISVFDRQHNNLTQGYEAFVAGPAGKMEFTHSGEALAGTFKNTSACIISLAHGSGHICNMRIAFEKN